MRWAISWCSRVRPAVALVGYALVVGGPLWGVGAAIVAVPASIVWYVLLLTAVKRVFIRRIEPGTYALESGAYLRYWFLQYALNNTRTLLLPLYATVYLPPLLRLLGAKIGKGAEVSTVMQFVPDLIEVGNGSFLADACMVGGARIHNGRIELGRVTIGEKAFIGNSALVPAAPMWAMARCWACFPARGRARRWPTTASGWARPPSPCRTSARSSASARRRPIARRARRNAIAR